MISRESASLFACLMAIGGLTFFSGKRTVCRIQPLSVGAATMSESATPPSESLKIPGKFDTGQNSHKKDEPVKFFTDADSRRWPGDSQLWSNTGGLMVEGSSEN